MARTALAMPEKRHFVHANAKMSHPEPDSAPPGFDERGAGRYQGLRISTRAVDQMQAGGRSAMAPRPAASLSMRQRSGPAGAPLKVL